MIFLFFHPKSKNKPGEKTILEYQDKLVYYTALNLIPDFDIKKKHFLLQHFGNVEEIFNQTDDKIKNILMRHSSFRKKNYSFSLNHYIDKAVDEIDKAIKKDINIITFEEKSYPKNLLSTIDYPIVLYCYGNLEEQDDRSVAIVGTRKASSNGLRNSYQLAKDLSKFGITIVSGLAKGIDGAAHLGAIEHRGRTIAVLGCGLDIIYPKDNEKIFYRIPDCGAVITEYPFGTKPVRMNFPMRNRIISGLTVAIVVVEGSKDSGSLITAKIGLESGREIYAFPGPINDVRYTGGHDLIKKGAKLIENCDELLSDLEYVLDIDFSNSKKENIAVNQNYRITEDSQREKDFVKEVEPDETGAKSTVKKEKEIKHENGDAEQVEKEIESDKDGNSEVLSSLEEKEMLVLNTLTKSRHTHIDKIVETTELEVRRVLQILSKLELLDLCVQPYSNVFVRK